MTMSLFGSAFDPFQSAFTDPFGGFGDIVTPLTFGLGDVVPTGRRTRTRRRGAASTGTDVDVDYGHWHFDYYLTEPVQLELEEHNDCYLMRLFHPGVAKEKIKLDIDNDTLIVSGDYQPEQEQQQLEQGQGQGQEEKKTETPSTGTETAASVQGKTQTQTQTQGQQQQQGAAVPEHGLAKTRIAPRRQYKRFVRYMALPMDVDQQSIEAQHKDEYLMVCLRKKQGTTPRVQRIPIK